MHDDAVVGAGCLVVVLAAIFAVGVAVGRSAGPVKPVPEKYVNVSIIDKKYTPGYTRFYTIYINKRLETRSEWVPPRHDVEFAEVVPHSSNVSSTLFGQLATGTEALWLRSSNTLTLAGEAIKQGE